jgi:hypothetical protein
MFKIKRSEDATVAARERKKKAKLNPAL